MADVGTVNDTVAEAVVRDLTRSGDVAQLMEWIQSLTRVVNRHQEALVDHEARITDGGL